LPALTTIAGEEAAKQQIHGRIQILGNGTPLVRTWMRKACSLMPSKHAPAEIRSNRIIPRLHQSEAGATPPAIASGAM
jgi:hypothetical protein